ncbi:hypothetical protein PVAG01_00890 [Phlyctema vagabunda]|uniref:Uncharacterized protein n=1 Tax=Phlyctema vagabunda TaxID=108571 RepID=A0ABR4PVL2_9HELO
MDQILKIKDTFVDYFSPSKRRRTIAGPTTPTKGNAITFLPSSAPVRRTTQVTSTTRVVSSKRLSLPSTKQFPAGSRKRAREEEIEDDPVYGTPPRTFERDEDYEAEAEDFTEVLDEDSKSDEPESDLTSEIQIKEEEEDDGVFDGGSEISADDKVRLYLARQKKLESIRGQLDETIARGNWTEEERSLLQKLAARSFEPLFPLDWHIDFLTWPEILFAREMDRPFINNNCSSNSRAVKALRSLVGLSSRVKDKQMAKLPEERVMALEVKRYIKWAEEDGGYHKLRFIPNLVVVTSKPTQSQESMSKDIVSQLTFLGNKYRDSLRLPDPYIDEFGELQEFSSQPPIIYGILIARSITLLWTLDSSKRDACPKFISKFDFSEEGMEAWNAIALAIFIVMARNYIMAIKDKLEPDIDTDSDPDL